MRIIFMGTPDFAVPRSKGVARQHEVIAIITARIALLGEEESKRLLL